MSRLGDKQALSHIMTQVRKLEINDDVVYEVFPDIIYTRQRDAIAYVVEALHSEDKNCESANPEIRENIPCAYRIMEYLAPLLKIFHSLSAPVGIWKCRITKRHSRKFAIGLP